MGIFEGIFGRSDAEEYLTALRVCLFFGKSLLLARGFAAATLLHRSAAGPGGGGGGAAGETRQVDVWAFPGDGRGAVRRVVGSESEEEPGGREMPSVKSDKTLAGIAAKVGGSKR